MAFTRRSLPDVLAQTGANIVRRVVPALPPVDTDSKRDQIRRWLKEPASTRVKLAKSGKRKGHFIQKGARNKQLQRAHLIVQARRRKAGLPGLYGKAMLHEAGKFKQRASVSVGYAKSLWLPIATALNEVVRYKLQMSLLFKGVARWPGSAGSGQVTLPVPGSQPTLSLQIGSAQLNVQGDDRLFALEQVALQSAVDDEGREASRWAEEMMAKSGT